MKGMVFVQLRYIVLFALILGVNYTYAACPLGDLDDDCDIDFADLGTGIGTGDLGFSAAKTYDLEFSPTSGRLSVIASTQTTVQTSMATTA